MAKQLGYAVSIVNIEKDNKDSNFKKRETAEDDWDYIKEITQIMGLKLVNEDPEAKECKDGVEINFRCGDWDHEKGEMTNSDSENGCCKCLKCQIKSLDHSHSECFLLAISSHGLLDGGDPNVQFIDGCYIPLSEIFDALSDANCPTLAGKPRILLLQICRNNPSIDPRTDYGDKVYVLQEKDDTKAVIEKESFNPNNLVIPLDVSDVNLPPNFMVVYPCVAGYRAPRGGRGSWMFKELFKVLNKKRETVRRETVRDGENSQPTRANFFQIVTQVTGIVAREYMTRMYKRNEDEENMKNDKGQYILLEGSGYKTAVCLEHKLKEPFIFTIHVEQ